MTPLGESGPRVAIVGLGGAEVHAAGYLLANTRPELSVDVFQAPADLTRRELRTRYDAVLYAATPAADRRPDIPGADLAGVSTAAAFMAWLHGRPEPSDLTFDLGCRRAIVVGDGGQALEVAAGLALGRDAPSVAALTEPVLGALQASALQEVVVLSHEGPEQTTFDDRQIQALADGSLAALAVDPAELAVPARYREAAPSDAARRTLDRLNRLASVRPVAGCPRIALRFLLSPTRIVGAGRVQAVELVRNTLERDPDGRLHAQPTGARATIPAGLVIFADTAPPAPLPVADAPTAAVADEHGRVRTPDGRPTGEYVSRSVLETVRVVLEDLADRDAGGAATRPA